MEGVKGQTQVKSRSAQVSAGQTRSVHSEWPSATLSPNEQVTEFQRQGKLRVQPNSILSEDLRLLVKSTSSPTKCCLLKCLTEMGTQ